jgi:hypothetical protein
MATTKKKRKKINVKKETVANLGNTAGGTLTPVVEFSAKELGSKMLSGAVQGFTGLNRDKNSHAKL